MTTLTISEPRRMPIIGQGCLPKIGFEPLKVRLGQALGVPAILPGRWYL